ncbi:MAG: AAA ATPase [Candidatus Amesbacteria bacterium GW2011_GWA2_47_70]|uniref:AAA ATPase n=1 Tax=Candidatus Amesbacteria bacterium GW2011_GWC2_45_19 TaxID=1618366 RepID=A0A0G1Q244_9BACT|nr:MAG: AAA ATPase [Candidatus Amesbacteria bacterium GW2011_GWC2_45_19]KKU37671.1 MAG: AAA ATPase [Candidatus Amesbacteria bacterium GW2011_GWA1_46_35]KKU68450.1 MAG: hypothetical protein UX93_C0007G0002 [Microgenomates group bacterium GW2011_GWC1_47_20]KKU79992.1 MAG: AAA ATPase [Candidatus Amesbacteria bacterium GW2011_GWA2_47_70]
MNIKRILEPVIIKTLNEVQKSVIIYGSRQVGKTTLANELMGVLGGKPLVLNGDQRGAWWEALTSRELPKIKLLVSGYDVLLVDEAQRIPEIGLSLKIIIDNFRELKVIVTGSSSLDLASKISEPLTGRAYTYKLWPISTGELGQFKTPFELGEELEERLIFGSYPRIFSIESFEGKIEYLRNLLDANLYKDLLEFGDIRNSVKIRDLLKLLAFQIGSQVSLTELASALELSRVTVDRYIDLLEKSFIIFRLGGFSRNLRKEVSKMDKIYFYDLGVRNVLIDNLKPLKDRNDRGQLWENFLVVERIKKLGYAGEIYSHYYWRLSSGAEFDLVEEKGGKLTGFEFKSSQRTVRAPKSWLETYTGSDFQVINRDNWLEFVK